MICGNICVDIYLVLTTIFFRVSLNLWAKRSASTDVTLVCKNLEEVRAHRFILEAGSDYFRDNLEAIETFELPLITKQELEVILEFLYTGQVRINFDSQSYNQDRLDEVADLLKIAWWPKCSDRFKTLPNEVIFMILNFMTTFQLLRVVSLVSKRFRDFVQTPYIHQSVSIVISSNNRWPAKQFLSSALYVQHLSFDLLSTERNDAEDEPVIDELALCIINLPSLKSVRFLNSKLKITGACFGHILERLKQMVHMSLVVKQTGLTLDELRECRNSLASSSSLQVFYFLDIATFLKLFYITE